MSRIALTAAALEALARNTEFAQWRRGEAEGKAPLLHYYRRCYSTAHDGTIAEHGDGFILTFVDPLEIKETKHIAFKKVALSGGGSIFVGASKSVLANDFSIGSLDGIFAREPRTSRGHSSS